MPEEPSRRVRSLAPPLRQGVSALQRSLAARDLPTGPRSLRIRFLSTVVRPLRRTYPVPSFDLVCVYRARNAGYVRALAAQTTGDVRLWALDDGTDDLAPLTTGRGPGTRFENLNRLVRERRDERWLVVADDDVSFVSGDLPQLVALCRRAGLDLAMASHDFTSSVNWPSTRCRPGLVARLTRFVDQGPLIVLSPAAQERLLPFDESLGMGWGAEIVWAEAEDLRIGIVDAVRVRHLPPASGGTYDAGSEGARAEAMLAASRWSSWDELQRTRARWHRLRRRPPWQAEPDDPATAGVAAARR